MAYPRVKQHSDDEQPVFYYDLGSPACYLAAERIMAELPVVPEWEPVAGAALGHVEELERSQVEALTARHGLQPVRWPAHWPPDTTEATLAASYAKRIGRAVAFSLATFRQVFAGGRDLGERDTVLIAAAACEMHPSAVLKGIELRATRQALADALERARAAGVSSLPAIAVGGRLFEGVDALETAARAGKGQAA
jgi:2-hydroxychromene-2-carboxylate isomerase